MLTRIVLLTMVAAASALSADWKPVTPEMLSLAKPKLDPNADAEAMFWEAWVSDALEGGQSLTHRVVNYKRIKLYNERGVKQWGEVSIPYSPSAGWTIFDIQARTILPDGTIANVPGSAVFDSTAVKKGRMDLKVKKFAFPRLTPGAIIEFQYTDTFTNHLPRYTKLEAQLEIPAWEITYYVKPMSSQYVAFNMRSFNFNCRHSPWAPAKANGLREGYMFATLTDMPAFVEEPLMPDEEDAKAWILIYYSAAFPETGPAYWRVLGQKIHEQFRRDIRVNGEIKALAAELTAAAQTIEQKATALATFCQNSIGNVDYNAGTMTSEQRERYVKKLSKADYSSADTLKHKLGNSEDIIGLFYALAQAAGLNPAYVRSSTARGGVLRPEFLDPYLLKRSQVAVKDGANVLYYNPGNPYLAPGMLDWREQGQPALLMDKEPHLVILPVTPSAASHLRREMRLKLSPEGAISGTVTMHYSGHTAVKAKVELDDQSAGSREETKKKELEARFPGAKVTDVTIENATATRDALKVQFNISMEGYAQRTGKRLFIQPSLFQHGRPALFSQASRLHPIFFPNAYQESDDIVIELPEGFALESPDVPGSFKLGQAGSYQMTASITQPKRELKVTRRFVWGDAGQIRFNAEAYPALKSAFNRIHDSDAHSFTLRAQ